MKLCTPRIRLWLLAFVSLTVAYTILGVYSEIRNRTPLLRAYQQIRVGMTQQEVEALLGPRTSGLDVTDHSLSYWNEGTQSIEIDFAASWDTGESVVRSKAFLSPTWWEMAEEWWTRRRRNSP
jgi:hypothetical protein